MSEIMSENNNSVQMKKDTKPVETLILANCGAKKDCKNSKISKDQPVVKKEDEKIITKVMTIIEGYDWNLVQPQKKTSSEIKKEHIKRPMNAFMVWAQAARKVMSKQHPHLQNSELSKSLGKLWKGLDKVDRQPFIDHAEKLRSSHKQEHPDYKYQPRRKKSKLMNNSSTSNPLLAGNTNSLVSTKQSQLQKSLSNSSALQEIVKNCSTASSAGSQTTTKRTYNTQNNRNDKSKRPNASEQNPDSSSKNIIQHKIVSGYTGNNSRLSKIEPALLQAIEKFPNTRKINFTEDNLILADERSANRSADHQIGQDDLLWKRIDMKSCDMMRKIDYSRQIDSPCSTTSSMVSINEANPLTPPATPYATSSTTCIVSNSIPMASIAATPISLMRRTSPDLRYSNSTTQPFVSPNQLQQQQHQQQNSDYTDYSHRLINPTIQTPSGSSSSSGSSIDNQSFTAFGHESYMNSQSPAETYLKQSSSSYLQNYPNQHYQQIHPQMSTYGNLNDCGLLSTSSSPSSSSLNSHLTSYSSQCSVAPSMTPAISTTYLNYSIQPHHHSVQQSNANYHPQQAQEDDEHQQQHPQQLTTTANQMTQQYLAPIDTDYIDPKEIDQYLVATTTLSPAMHHQQNQMHNSIMKMHTATTCINSTGAGLILPTVVKTFSTTVPASLPLKKSSCINTSSVMIAPTADLPTAATIVTAPSAILYNRTSNETNLLDIQRAVVAAVAAADNKCMNENLNKINLANSHGDSSGAAHILNHSSGTNMQPNPNNHNLSKDVVQTNANRNNNDDNIDYYQSLSNNNNNNNNIESNPTNYPYATWNYSNT